MTPITAEITNKRNGRKVLVVVRDYCRACHKGKAAIDLSPAAFIALGLTLEEGVGKVRVRYLGAR
jgi:rare lipoprotein A (peptidoglycan hydrolase)